MTATVTPLPVRPPRRLGLIDWDGILTTEEHDTLVSGMPPECLRRRNSRAPVAARDVAAVHGRWGSTCWNYSPDDSHGETLHLAHLVPHALGGCEHAHNLILLCRDCNCEEGAALDRLDQWLALNSLDHRWWAHRLFGRRKP